MACIYSSAGSYQVSPRSANGTGTRFRPASGSDFMNPIVRWNDGVSGLTRDQNGIPLTGLVGNSTSPDCGGTNPATIQVNIRGGVIRAAPIGHFSDALTVIITPQ